MGYFDLDIHKIREEMISEYSKSINLSYLCKKINEWWDTHQHLNSSFLNFLFLNLQKDDLAQIIQFNLKSRIFAFFIDGLPQKIQI
ncbi:hypothetical protein [Helicobacter typhlonius]|uniref:hypothetical protein n=1 Tax=Helicobacter typhlonius TaxID=76936 RepID=UPI002FE0957C